MVDLGHYKGNNKHLEVVINTMTNSQLRTMFAMCPDLNVQHLPQTHVLSVWLLLVTLLWAMLKLRRLGLWMVQIIGVGSWSDPCLWAPFCFTLCFLSFPKCRSCSVPCSHCRDNLLRCTGSSNHWLNSLCPEFKTNPSSWGLFTSAV